MAMIETSQRTISKPDFIEMSAEERIAAVDQIFGREALLLTSMQKPSCVLMHMISRVQAHTRILFVDTQYHFPETLELRDRFIEKYGLNIETAYPELTPEQQKEKYGCELYLYPDGQPDCCRMRKTEPFLKTAQGIKALINSTMRAEGGKRGIVEPISNDPRLNCLAFNALFDWSYDQIDAYTLENEIPVHPLYAKNYLSIGCATCTTPVLPGEDRRAGRWRHLRTVDGQQPTYCHINFGDGSGI